MSITSFAPRAFYLHTAPRPSGVSLSKFEQNFGGGCFKFTDRKVHT